MRRLLPIFLTLVVLGALGAEPTNQTPLDLSYLQSDMDGNQRSGTNYFNLISREFISTGGVFRASDTQLSLTNNLFRTFITPKAFYQQQWDTRSNAWQYMLNWNTLAGHFGLYRPTSQGPYGRNVFITSTFDNGGGSIWLYDAVDENTIQLLGSAGLVQSKTNTAFVMISSNAVSTARYTNTLFSGTPYVLTSDTDKTIKETTTALADLTTDAEFNLWTNGLAGTNYVNAATNGLAGTNWVIDATNHLDPFKIIQQGAVTNQVLKWNGTRWEPSDDLQADLSGAVDAATVTNIANYLDQTATNNAYQWSTNYANGATNVLFTTLNNLKQHGSVNLTNWSQLSTNVLAPYASTNYVQASTNGFVDASITNNVALRVELVSATNNLDPYKLLPQGASSGQVLKWDGAKWAPAADNSAEPDGGIDEATATNIAQYALLTGTNQTYQWATNYANIATNNLYTVLNNRKQEGSANLTNWSAVGTNQVLFTVHTNGLAGTNYVIQATNDLAALIHTKANTNMPTLYSPTLRTPTIIGYLDGTTWAVDNNGYFTANLFSGPHQGNGAGLDGILITGVAGLFDALTYLTNSIVTTNGFVDASITNTLAYRAELVSATNNLDPYKIIRQGASSGQVLSWDGSKWAPANPVTPDAGIDATTATNIAAYQALIATNNLYLTINNRKQEGSANLTNWSTLGTNAVLYPVHTNGLAGTNWVISATNSIYGVLTNYTVTQKAAATNGLYTYISANFATKPEVVSATNLVLQDSTNRARTYTIAATNGLNTYIEQTYATKATVATKAATNWVTDNFYPLVGNPSGFLSSVDLSDITQSEAAIGNLPMWNGVAWVPRGGNPLLGDFLIYASDGWTKTNTIHPSRIAGGGASSGNFMYWDGSEWAGVELGLSDISVGSAAPGQFVKQVGGAWSAADIGLYDLSQSSASLGQVPKWSGTQWLAGTDDDTLGALGATASPGGFARYGGAESGGWTNVDNIPLSAIDSGGANAADVLVYNPGAGGWQPTPLDLDYLGQSGAGVGQVPKWNGENWVPGEDTGLTTVALSNITQSGASVGQVPKWSGTAWVPGSDNTGGGGSMYSDGATTTENSTTHVFTVASGITSGKVYMGKFIVAGSNGAGVYKVGEYNVRIIYGLTPPADCVVVDTNADDSGHGDLDVAWAVSAGGDVTCTVTGFHPDSTTMTWSISGFGNGAP